MQRLRALEPLLVLQFDTEWLYGCVVLTFFLQSFLHAGLFLRIIYSWIYSFYRSLTLDGGDFSFNLLLATN